MKTRKEVASDLKLTIDQVDDQLDVLEAKGRKLNADTQTKFNKSLAMLKAQRDLANKKLLEVRKANEQAWTEIEDGANKAYIALRDSFDRARSHLN